MVIKFKNPLPPFKKGEGDLILKKSLEFLFLNSCQRKEQNHPHHNNNDSMVDSNHFWNAYFLKASTITLTEIENTD
jgi:hypothetical protein